MGYEPKTKATAADVDEGVREELVAAAWEAVRPDLVDA